MLFVVLVTLATGVWSGYVYVRKEQLGLTGLALTTLRTAGVAVLLVLLVNPGRASPVVGGPPVVLLDGSLSMNVGGGWAVAVDTAQALAGPDGTILEFGSSVGPFDTLPPTAGASRLRSALFAAQATGGPVYVVTDGEIEDVGAIPSSVFERVAFVLVARDTVADAALLDVKVPPRVRTDDSIQIEVSIGVWGTSEGNTALLEVTQDDRRLALSDVRVPGSPSMISRRITVAPGRLPAGRNVITVRATLDGDAIPGNDKRQRIVLVSELPAVVVAVDSPDWEGRFIASEIAELTGTDITSYARIMDETWLDMETLQRVPVATVRRAATRASMLVVRGREDALPMMWVTGQPIWTWPGGIGSHPSLSVGDWYASSNIPASPLAGDLGRVDWDSLPPLAGLIQGIQPEDGWVALSARLGRRGNERPVLVGRTAGGVRELSTLGSGLWRWRFRGGASREAYRALLAAGMNWLLGADAVPDAPSLTATAVVSLGEPLQFRWLGRPAPDSVVVDFKPVSREPESSAVLRFDTRGYAVHELPPGTYEWSVRGMPDIRGLSVVEEYSSEYAPRRVGVESGGSTAGTVLAEHHVREYWWLFVLAVATLAAEWSWRHRRGLP